MEKMIALRSIFRAASSRSSRISSISHRCLTTLTSSSSSSSRSRSTLSSSSLSLSPNNSSNVFTSPFAMGMGSTRSFSEDVARFPEIKDPDILNAFKELLAASWDDLPNAVVYDAKKALSKNTDDKAGQNILKNVFRAAEAVEEFGGMLMSLKMELDDMIGMSGEEVKPLPDVIRKAVLTFFQRYSAYLESFGPEEGYLQKKVETELGSKMIFLKMRCGGLGPEWGKVTVLATSGLSGSYIEQRA